MRAVGAREKDARDRNIITDDEYALLMEAKVAIRNAIKVDEFSFPGWKVETP